MSTASDAGHPREGIPGISVFENIGLRITCVSKVFCHKELLLGLREGVAEEGIMGPAVPDSPTGIVKTVLAVSSSTSCGSTSSSSGGRRLCFLSMQECVGGSWFSVLFFYIIYFNFNLILFNFHFLFEFLFFLLVNLLF